MLLLIYRISAPGGLDLLFKASEESLYFRLLAHIDIPHRLVDQFKYLGRLIGITLVDYLPAQEHDFGEFLRVMLAVAHFKWLAVGLQSL